MVIAFNWLRVPRRSWCPWKEHKNLYRRDNLFVENKQSLKEMSNFISFFDVIECGLVSIVLSSIFLFSMDHLVNSVVQSINHNHCDIVLICSNVPWFSLLFACLYHFFLTYSHNLET